jgi:hypothetical protein
MQVFDEAQDAEGTATLKTWVAMMYDLFSRDAPVASGRQTGAGGQLSVSSPRFQFVPTSYLYAFFCEYFTDLKCSLSSFYAYKPKHIKCETLNECICALCYNFNALTKAYFAIHFGVHTHSLNDLQVLELFLKTAPKGVNGRDAAVRAKDEKKKPRVLCASGAPSAKSAEAPAHNCNACGSIRCAPTMEKRDVTGFDMAISLICSEVSVHLPLKQEFTRANPVPDSFLADMAEILRSLLSLSAEAKKKLLPVGFSEHQKMYPGRLTAHFTLRGFTRGKLVALRQTVLEAVKKGGLPCHPARWTQIDQAATVVLTASGTFWSRETQAVESKSDSDGGDVDIRHETEVCEAQERLEKLVLGRNVLSQKCILGQCDDCGFDAVFGQCAAEHDEEAEVSVDLIQSLDVDASSSAMQRIASAGPRKTKKASSFKYKAFMETYKEFWTQYVEHIIVCQKQRTALYHVRQKLQPGTLLLQLDYSSKIKHVHNDMSTAQKATTSILLCVIVTYCTLQQHSFTESVFASTDYESDDAHLTHEVLRHVIEHYNSVLEVKTCNVFLFSDKGPHHFGASLNLMYIQLLANAFGINIVWSFFQVDTYV